MATTESAKATKGNVDLLAKLSLIVIGPLFAIIAWLGGAQLSSIIKTQNTLTFTLDSLADNVARVEVVVDERTRDVWTGNEAVLINNAQDVQLDDIRARLG